MNENQFAVLIGTNTYEDSSLQNLRYAEKDCEDVYREITDKQIGTFYEDNVVLLVGEGATTRAVQNALNDCLRKNRTEQDVVLIYFSGHGFTIHRDNNLETYLGTRDVSLEALPSPYLGVRMEDLHDMIFKSAARQVVLILDCCHSGGIIPVSMRNAQDQPNIHTTNAVAREFINERFMIDQGRIALVACPFDASARESLNMQNGVFTHYIIQGLHGKAAEPDTGEVTVDSLMAFVRNHAPSEQLPGRYGHDFGRFVLTKPGPREPEIIKVDLEQSSSVRLNPLAYPLEPYERYVSQLIEILADRSFALKLNVEDTILEAIRLSSEAEFVFVLRGDRDTWVPRAVSQFKSAGQNRDEYIKSIVSNILPAIHDGTIFKPDHNGLHYRHSANSKVIMVTPLREKPTKEVLIVSGLADKFAYLGDVYARILSTVYSASRELTSLQADKIEAAVLDDLKQTYGYVSIDAYNHRFEIFKQHLEPIGIHFQPVIKLHTRAPYIDSWEALARDPTSGLAPHHLFHAAELWGAKFMIELDQYFITKAVQDYQETLADTPGRRRAEDVRELSVNVYPESLIRTAYFETVQELLARKGSLLEHKVILEISEKSPIPVPKQYGRSGKRLETFRKYLGERYVNRLGVGFALDDFGAGHASFSRLLGLRPTYIKIDRSILHQEYGDKAIHYIYELATQGVLYPPKVIVEGFDGSGRISLQQLYENRIRYIQGYIFGKPKATLGRLERADKDMVVKRIGAK